MTIYHGGADVIRSPQIISIYSGCDFGAGFYTTDIQEQAVKWALRQARYRKKDEAFLNIYSFNDAVFDYYNVKTFNSYTMDWLDFVISCRTNVRFAHKYDILIGKIANDDVGEIIQAVISGLISKDLALSELVYMEANYQICFSTVRALKYLNFVTVERVL